MVYVKLLADTASKLTGGRYRRGVEIATGNGCHVAWAFDRTPFSASKGGFWLLSGPDEAAVAAVLAITETDVVALSAEKDRLTAEIDAKNREIAAKDREIANLRAGRGG